MGWRYRYAGMRVQAAAKVRRPRRAIRVRSLRLRRAFITLRVLGSRSVPHWSVSLIVKLTKK